MFAGCLFIPFSKVQIARVKYRLVSHRCVSTAMAPPTNSCRGGHGQSSNSALTWASWFGFGFLNCTTLAPWRHAHFELTVMAISAAVKSLNSIILFNLKFENYRLTNNTFLFKAIQTSHLILINDKILASQNFKKWTQFLNQIIVAWSLLTVNYFLQ